MYYQTRNLIDVRVGKKHSIQIRLHLRIEDVQWFNKDSEVYKRELIHDILSKQIFPIECKDVIEKYYFGKRSDGGGRTGSSEGGNKIDDNDDNNNSKNKNKGGNGKKRSIKTKSKPKKNRKSDNNNDVDGDGDENPVMTNLSSFGEKHYRFYFSNHLKVLYKCEDTATKSNSYNPGRCIINYVNYSEDTSNGLVGKVDFDSSKGTNDMGKQNKHLSKFEAFIPIPKLIVVWCYPFDRNNPNNELNMSTVGHTFPREDFIPISKLFNDCND